MEREMSDLEKRVLQFVSKTSDAASKKALENPTDEAYGRIQSMIKENDEQVPVEKVKSRSFEMTTLEKQAFYRGVLDMVNAEENPERIAHNVLSSVIEKINSIKERITTNGAEKGPVFRRVDD